MGHDHGLHGNRPAPALDELDQMRDDRPLPLEMAQLGVASGRRQPAVEKASAQMPEEVLPVGTYETGGSRPAQFRCRCRGVAWRLEPSPAGQGLRRRHD